MYLSPRHLLVFVVPLLVLAAIFGFVAGKRHGRPAPVKEQGLLAHQANVVVEYPVTWRSAGGAPAIPGVSVANPLLLAPGGDTARAGLLIGQLPAGGGGPLPSGLVALMPRLPPTEIVSFADAQAYRYGPTQLSGYAGTVEAYVIPSSTGPATTLICYAAQGSPTYIGQCEQIAATLTLVENSGYDLTPQPAYAGRLSALVGALDGERITLRREMAQRRTPAATAVLARTLAQRLATAAAALRAVPAPAAANAAQGALVVAIERARAGYGALATAALAASTSAVSAAQTQVSAAESGVDAALATFALLGYQRA